MRLEEQPDNTVTYVCGHVFEGSRPAKKVIYEESYDIQVLCGLQDHIGEYELPKLIGLSEALSKIEENIPLLEMIAGQQAILNKEGCWEIISASNTYVPQEHSRLGETS